MNPLRDHIQDFDILCLYYHRVFELNILPYYLHLLDPVAGAMHFDVPEARGIELIRQLRSTLPGYLVPRLVRETPHGDSKALVLA